MWATKLKFQIWECFFASLSPSSLAGGQTGRRRDPWEVAKRDLFFFMLYIFLKSILLTMLLQLSQFCPPPSSTYHCLRQSPHHCSCPWVMHISFLATPFPILYCISPWLFCNYLFVLLNALTFSPTPPHPSHLATIKMLSVSMILSLFFLFA